MNTTLTIGELAQMTGLTTHTLRVWEKRYQALRVLRLASGHRRYPRTEVDRLRAVNRALERGYKPKDVSGKSLHELESMVKENPFITNACQTEVQGHSQTVSPMIYEWLTATDYFDETGLVSLLQLEWDQRSPLSFIGQCVNPFLKMIGLRWEKKELSVAQEHFGSDIISNFLSTQWRTLNKKNKGKPVVLTTLPGEPHGLGVLMCAVVTAFAGRRVISLGVNTPFEDMVQTVKRSQAVALGLSISSHFQKEKAIEGVEKIAGQLPGTTKLFVGGEGCPECKEGVISFNNWENYFLDIKNQLPG